MKAQRVPIAKQLLRRAVNVSVCYAAEDLKDHVVEQIAEWLSLGAVGRENWMDARVEGFQLEDPAHPAFARFKAVFEPLDIRKAERGMRFCQVCAPADSFPDESNAVPGQAL